MGIEEAFKKTRIISAFPATGKSTLTKKGYEDATFLDLDSSGFKDDWPASYFKAIQNAIGTVDYILISSHTEVRDHLVDQHYSWTLVNPYHAMRNEIIGRLHLRGDSQDMIGFIAGAWDSITDVTRYNAECAKCMLGSNEYLADKMYFISTTPYNTKQWND